MIKPLGEYLLIEPDKNEEKTVGGIIVPEMRKDRPQTGVLIEPFNKLQAGTKVWFKMWAGEDIEYMKEDKRVSGGAVKKGYKLIHKRDLIAYEGGDSK